MLSQKRGKSVALAGGLFQVIFTAVMITVWRYTGSIAAMCTAWLLAGGVLLWLIVALLFYFNELARREELELEEIESGRGGAGPTIFEGEEGVEMRRAIRRADWMNKWAVPFATLLLAFYQAGIAVLSLRFLFMQSARPLTEIGPASLFLGLTAFLAFLFSRYATGMGSSPQWRFLRATGGYLLVGVIFIAAVVLALLMAAQGYGNVDLIVAYAVCVVQLILAVELTLNFVLDLYRPRIPGKEYHPSFESRVFSILAEPDRVGHSIADTLNYQFGFEVSKTWFYRLVSRAFVPLLMLAVLIMFGMSSVVMVQQGQECVVTTFGWQEPAIGPGLHFKLPWPFATERRFNTDEVHEILLGVGEAREPTIIKGRELYLWTEEHGSRQERDFLVAIQPPKETVRQDENNKTGIAKTPPVAMIKLVVAVYYKITDVRDFGYNYTDSHEVLASLAYREMTRYYASATLMDPIRDNKPGPDGKPRPEAIMTTGREKAADNLRKIIQEKADDMKLGVRITHVGIISSHPPAKAAPSFENVAKAERARDSKRYAAEAEASYMLAGVAGDVDQALKLALEIRKLEQLTDLSGVTADQVAPLVDKYIAQINEEINLLNAEIEREHILGRADEDDANHALRKMFVEYLGTLEQIKADPAGFDYAQQVNSIRKTAGDMLEDARGEPAKLIAEAQAYRWQKELGEQALAEAFSRHLLAYRASPDIYLLDRYLEVWDEVLQTAASKQVLGIDPNKAKLWLDWKWKSDMMQGVTFEKEKEKK